MNNYRYTFQAEASPKLPQETKIAVVYGGEGSEREISIKGAQFVITHLKQLDVIVFDLCVDQVGEGLVKQLTALTVDLVFIMIHGKGGEDGVLQRLLNDHQMNYLGSDEKSSQLAWNKWQTKQVWIEQQLRTPEAVMIAKDSDHRAILQTLGGKVVVKPVAEGSSVGMKVVDTETQLLDAIDEAYQHADQVFVEAFIKGKEITVGIVDQYILPAIEIEVDQGFYDFHNKYVSPNTCYKCPSSLDSETLNKVNALAVEAYQTLGCRHWGRVDLMVSENNEAYLMEVNTVPGMTDKSLIPLAAKQLGMNASQLLSQLVGCALAEDVKLNGKRHE